MSTAMHTVICFCKHPNVGFVKSRLSKETDAQFATNVYQITLEQTLKQICVVDADVKLYCYPDSKHKFIKNLARKYSLTLNQQHGDDIGMRMFQALDECLKTAKNVVLIGSDCIQINKDYIQNAFNILEAGYDVVLGPTLDGGYALIGMQCAQKSLFQNINWSTDKVLQQTKKILTNGGWKYSCLPIIRDIDTYADYLYFKEDKLFQHIFDELN